MNRRQFFRLGYIFLLVSWFPFLFVLLLEPGIFKALIVCVGLFSYLLALVFTIELDRDYLN